LALERAKVGVAIFARLQWLETIGRYERLFKNQPPTLIAFFCERVALHMGEWKPDGGTATAYIWIVWIKDRTPQAPFWIPPGQREALTYADDAERFTAHPVIRKQHERAAVHAVPSGSAAPEPTPPLPAHGARRPGWKAWGNEALSAEPHVEASSPCVGDQTKHATTDLPNDDSLDIPNFLRIGHPECTWRPNEMKPE
jgi:hypothetical protein